MDTVTSRDGTTIAFDRFGDGPPVILVCGGSTDRMANAGLATALASDFTVFNYDRRGRGDSGDTPPYAIGLSSLTLLAMLLRSEPCSAGSSEVTILYPPR